MESRRTSVVLVTSGAPRALARTVRILVERSPADVEIIVVDNATDEPESLLAQVLTDEHPNVRIVRSPMRLGAGAAWNLGVAGAAGDVVMFVANGVAVEPGWIGPLHAALEAASIVGPRVLAPNGTILTTGLAADAEGGLANILRGLAGDDPRAAVAAPRTAVAHYCFAARRTALAAVHGFSAELPQPVAAADLSLRVAAAGLGSTTYEPRSAVVTKPRSKRDAASDGPAWHLLRAQLKQVSPAAAAAISHDPAPARAEPPPLRWSIKIAAPFSRRLRWGDYHFAQGVQAALQRLGQIVVVDSHDAWSRETARNDDVVLALRGIEAYQPRPGQLNLLWVISHVDAVTPDELEAYDHVFVAAAAPPASFAGLRRPAEPLLQATDAERFRPGPREDELHREVLFVGNSRWQMRPVIRDAMAADLPLTVYGDGWADLLPDDVVAADLIPNDQLPRYYRSAGVVLNDHWDDMRQHGLLSNRLFDLAACGATVISDAVPGIQAIFGDVVRTYEQPAELGPLVRRLLAAQEQPDPRREELSARVRAEHSFDARAHRLLAVAQRLQATRAPAGHPEPVAVRP